MEGYIIIVQEINASIIQSEFFINQIFHPLIPVCQLNIAILFTFCPRLLYRIPEWKPLYLAD